MAENTYPKDIERPYRVYAVTREEWPAIRSGYISDDWMEFLKAFRLESDAEAFAERMSEDYLKVRIERVEGDNE